VNPNFIIRDQLFW